MNLRRHPTIFIIGLLVLFFPKTLLAQELATQNATLEGIFSRTHGSFDKRNTARLSQEMTLWDSWSVEGKGVGRFRYGPFVAANSIELMIAGFPGSIAGPLSLIAADSNEKVLLSPRSPPGEYWTRYKWAVPLTMRGRAVFLVADDTSNDNGGWIGISLPLPASTQIGKAALESSLQIAVFILLLLPGLALLVYMPKADALRALSITLVGSAGTAYIVFHCYLVNPLTGFSSSFLALAISMSILVFRWRELLERLRQPEFCIPIFLGLFVTVIYFLGGFMYGGIESPEGVPMDRFLRSMPPDPLLPHWFAEILARGDPVTPFFSDWLTSDRPPLQTCLNLMVWPFIPKRIGYQALGIAAQCWVWIGLWAYLRQLRVNTQTTAIILCGSICSGFFFLNSIFCWPKLLPAAFVLLGAGLLFEGPKTEVPKSSTMIWAAACMSFAYLSHGGSIFGILAVALVYLIQRRAINSRFVLTSGLVCFLLVLPWSLYQRFIDPPGDRLVKYHIAGREAIDPRGSLTVIREAYAAKTWSEILNDRLANVRMLFWKHGQITERFSNVIHSSPETKTTAYNYLRYGLREAAFFHYFQAPGPLLFGLLGFIYAFVRRIKDESRNAAYTTSLFFLLSAFIWCALLFTREMTVIQTSAYFTGACLFICAGIGLSYWPKPVIYSILILNLLWFFWIWVFIPEIDNYGALLPSPFIGFTLPAVIGSIILTGVLLLVCSMPESITGLIQKPMTEKNPPHA